MSLGALKEEAVRSDPRLVSSAGVTGGSATDGPLRTIEPHSSFMVSELSVASLLCILLFRAFSTTTGV